VGIIVAALLQIYLCAKNYGNMRWFDKVSAKIKRVHFFGPNGVDANRTVSIVTWVSKWHEAEDKFGGLAEASFSILDWVE